VKESYDGIRKHGKKVALMEPVKSGSPASLSEASEKTENGMILSMHF
jgi:hypothetical protein